MNPEYSILPDESSDVAGILSDQTSLTQSSVFEHACIPADGLFGNPTSESEVAGDSIAKMKYNLYQTKYDLILFDDNISSTK